MKSSSRTPAVLLALLLLSAGLAQAQNPTCPGEVVPCRGGSLPGPLPLFPPTNWWNLDISAAPVDPNSNNFIPFMGGTKRQVHPDFGGIADEGANEIYGFPYVVVSGSQAKKTVQFEYADESDGVDHDNDDTSFPFYPIPDQAITQPYWIEGGPAGSADVSGDRHMLIVDRDNKHLYELFALRWNGTGWEAGSGAFFDLNTNNRRPEGWTSADAAGLAILPGLIRYEEVYLSPDPIRHAFRVTVSSTNGHVFPASHTAGSTAGALPMGARLRLKANKVVNSADPGVQRIVQAMKTYGLIVADNGSNMYVSGTFDERWDNGILNPALGQLRAGDFEVIQLGWVPQDADLAVTKTDGQSSVVAGSPLTYTITASNGGPAGAASALVTDSFPAAYTGVTWTCTPSAGSSCNGGGGTGNISRSIALAPGGTVTFVATGTVNVAATGTLVNTATVSSSAPDPNGANNSATDTDTLLRPADLSITKTDGRTSAAAGDTITYTLVAGNAGPQGVTGALVSDVLPSSLSGVTWTCTPTGTAACVAASGAGNISQTVDLPVSSTVIYTVNGTVVATPTSLTNTATVAVPAGYADPQTANNSATDRDIVLCGDERVLTPDGRGTQHTVGANASAWFLMNLRIGSSYSLELRTKDGMSPGVLTVFTGDSGCTLSGTATLRDTSSLPPGQGAATRYSFRAEGAEPAFRARVTNNTGSLITFSASLAETTLYSPSWSTGGTNNTHYAFQNTTQSAISGTLTFRNTAGAVVGTFPVPVPAGATAATNTSALDVVRNTAGTVQFVHDGPPGSVVALASINNFGTTPAYVQPVPFQSTREVR